MSYGEIANKTVAKVENVSDESFTLIFQDGSKAVFGVEGDCCSKSYFTTEAIQEIKALNGRTIFSVKNTYSHSEESEQVQFSFLIFTTNHGHVTLDWRNVSNGYYSGYVTFKFTPTSN